MLSHIQIPCRTATRGSFPLNGTYFQVNEVSLNYVLLVFGNLNRYTLVLNFNIHPQGSIKTFFYHEVICGPRIQH